MASIRIVSSAPKTNSEPSSTKRVERDAGAKPSAAAAAAPTPRQPGFIRASSAQKDSKPPVVATRNLDINEVAVANEVAIGKFKRDAQRSVATSREAEWWFDSSATIDYRTVAACTNSRGSHTLSDSSLQESLPTMDCPGCGVEMVDLVSDDQTLRKCGECGGLWVDVSDLNRILLHHSLPGLEALGGKLNPDALSGQCPDCQVDLVQVEGGERGHRLEYDACESCGGVFLESEFENVSDYATAKTEIVDFFTHFATHLLRGRKVAHA